MMGNGYSDGWMASGSWGFWIACLLGLVLLAVGTALTVLLLWDRTRPPPPAPPRSERSGAARLLEERYAAGEIDDDEFRHRRSLLDP